jgi:hypothetical protein
MAADNRRRVTKDPPRGIITMSDSGRNQVAIKEGLFMKKRLVLFCSLLALTSLIAFAASVDGKWTSEAMGKGGPQTFTFKASGSTLTGTVEGGRGGSVDITNGKIDGDKVSFDVVREMGGNSMTMKYSGSVSGTTMKLSVDMGRGPREVTLTKQ